MNFKRSGNAHHNLQSADQCPDACNLLRRVRQDEFTRLRTLTALYSVVQAGPFAEGYFSLLDVPTNLPGLSVIDADAIFAQFGTDWKRMIVHGKELVFCPECLKK